VKEPAVGSQRIIVILVDFPDVSHRYDLKSIHHLVFDDMNNFYQWSSYNMTWIEGDVAPKWYRMATPMSKLDVQQWDYSDKGLKKLASEAIAAANADVDYSRYDYVCIFAAGDVSGIAKQYAIPNNDGLSYFRVIIVSEYGVDHAGFYAIAHELAHVLGRLLDLYSYDAAYSGRKSNIFVGDWDLMSNSRAHVGFSAFSKLALGWIDAKELSLDDDKLYFEDLEPLDSTTGLRVIMIPVANYTYYPTVYYLIESRRKIAYDAGLPGSGVVICLVNGSVEKGYGRVRVGSNLGGSLDKVALKVGDCFRDYKNNVHIYVLRKSGDTFTLVFSASSFDTETLMTYTTMLQSVTSRAISTITSETHVFDTQSRQPNRLSTSSSNSLTVPLLGATTFLISVIVAIFIGIIVFLAILKHMHKRRGGLSS
jgi:M6 family metalloprotease-like protein